MLNVAVKDGGFGEVKEIKGSPIPDEQVMQNIRDSMDFPYPVTVKAPEREGTLVFVAGGPTMLDYLEEIKRRSFAGETIITSNNTYDFLVDNGITPTICLLFDPKEKVKDYIKKPQKATQFYIATCCNKLTVQAIAASGAPIKKVLIAYGLEGAPELALQRELYPHVGGTSYLIGGTMTPLRAIPFGYMLGYRHIEFYGMDSCFGQNPPIIKEGEEGYAEALMKNGVGYEDGETGAKYVILEPEEGGYFYAYKKKRQEDIIVAEAGPRRFLTTPGFAYQAKQLVEWVDRMEDKMKVTLHGDSLSSYLVARHWAAKEQMRAMVGNARWTPEYAEMQHALHAEGKYGVRGHRNRGGSGLEIVSKLVVSLRGQLKRDVTVLDYGCGNGAMKIALEDALKGVTVTNYDPFAPGEWSNDPEQHDMTICLDVMEHVEEPCVENTVRYIAERTRYGALFIISLQDAVKTLPDGRNAHVTVKNVHWWRLRLGKFLKVCEVSDHGHTGIFLCESQNAAEHLASETRVEEAA